MNDHGTRIPTRLALAWLALALPACGSSRNPPSDATDVPREDADAADDDAAAEDAAAADGDDAAGDAEDTLRPFGAPCTSWRDCAGRFCIDTSLDPSFVDGYCSALFCDPDFAGACGDTATCFDTEIFPPLCAKLCTTDADCRPPDYRCVGTCIPDDFTATLERPGVLTADDPTVAAALAAVDDARVMSRIRILAGEDPWESPSGPTRIVSRAVRHPDHAAAVAYLEAELGGLGLTVRRHEYTREGRTEVNLTAEIPGTEAALPPVLVTAHYDSIASETAGWIEESGPAPGAVDNGSGVAAALEVASILTASATPPRRTVRVVLFDDEETGLHGSAAYAAMLAEGAGSIDCAFNVDMVGWSAPATANRVWYVFDEASRERAALGAEAIALFVPELGLNPSSYDAAGYSDQSSFWAAGLCAVGMSSWPRLASNHTVEDTSAAFHLEYYRRIVRATVAAVTAWASR